jgi:sulfopyruvate decarboxylase TPP-binding subunit
MVTLQSDAPATDWRDDIYDLLLAADVRQVAYVPDAGHSRLIERCHATDTMRCVVLTTEEEGVAQMAGAWLGGQRGVVLMQSSGVGNCVNMFSLIASCRMPFVTLVTMRGEWGEFNPWQVQMGQATEAAFELGGVLVYRVDQPADVAPTLDAALRLAFDANTAVAILLSQRLVGRKDFAKD